MSRFKKKSKKKVNQSGSKFEEKFLKHYEEREAELLRSYDVGDLRRIVSECNANIIRSVNEVLQNSEYLAAKEVIKDFNQSLGEVRKYQGSKRDFAIQLLHEKGVVDAGLDDHQECYEVMEESLSWVDS